MGALRRDEDGQAVGVDEVGEEGNPVYFPRHRHQRERRVRVPAGVRLESLACFAGVEGQEGD